VLDIFNKSRNYSCLEKKRQIWKALKILIYIKCECKLFSQRPNRPVCAQKSLATYINRIFLAQTSEEDLTDVDVSTSLAPPLLLDDDPRDMINAASIVREREKERDKQAKDISLAMTISRLSDVAVCKRERDSRTSFLETSRRDPFTFDHSCPSSPFYRPYYVSAWRGLHGWSSR